MADRYRHVKGNSYRDSKGKFAKFVDVQNYYQAQATNIREAIFKQREQAARQSYHDRTGKWPNRKARVYSQERDDRLQTFKHTPRNKRTRQQWRQFRADMRYIYGSNRDDWGDYD